MDLTITVGVGVVSLIAFVAIVKYLVSAFLKHQEKTQIIMHTDLKGEICHCKDMIRHNRKLVDRNTNAILELTQIHMGLTTNEPANPKIASDLRTPIPEPEMRSGDKELRREVTKLYEDE